MSDGKTKAFSNEMDRLKDKVNTQENTAGKPLDALLAAHRLTMPVTAAQLAELPNAERGQILAAFALALAAIGSEVETPTWKNNLLGLGYPDIDAVVADIPALVAPQDVTAAENNIAALRNLTAEIDAVPDADFLAAVIGKVMAVRAKLAAASSVFRGV